MNTVKTHCCNELKLDQDGDEDDSLFMQYDHEAKSWMLVYKSYADDKEVEMGEAEYRGELVFSIELKINFCPYCGLKLPLQ